MYRMNIDQHWSTYASQFIFMDSEYNYQLYIHTYRSPRRLSPLLSGNGYHLYCPETTITFTVRKRGWQKDLATAVRIAAQKLYPPLLWGGGQKPYLPPAILTAYQSYELWGWFHGTWPSFSNYAVSPRSLSKYIYTLFGWRARLPETDCRNHGLHRHLRCCPTEWEEIEISMAERGLCECDERGLTTPVGTNGKLFNPSDTGI